LAPGNRCAMLVLSGWAMNPPVAKGATFVPFQPNVRGVAGSKLSQRKTFAVILDASKYLGALPLVVPADTRHVARPRSRDREAPWL